MFPPGRWMRPLRVAAAAANLISLSLPPSISPLNLAAISGWMGDSQAWGSAVRSREPLVRAMS